jgi:hypothetical protein
MPELRVSCCKRSKGNKINFKRQKQNLRIANKDWSKNNKTSFLARAITELEGSYVRGENKSCHWEAAEGVTAHG